MYDSFVWSDLSEERNKFLRAYEPVQPFLFLGLAEVYGSEWFFDIGANVGAYSIFMSALPKVERIDAFEPNPIVFDDLLANVRENDCSETIHVYKLALSSSAKLCQFGMRPLHTGHHAIIDTAFFGRDSCEEIIELETKRLDDLVQPLKKNIAIKIDVEGHELEALSGAVSLLKNNNILIQCEALNKGDALRQFFRDNGFTKICQIGPDIYYQKGYEQTTMCASGEVIEKALSLAVERSKIRMSSRPASLIRRKLFPNVVLEIKGRLATRLRKISGK